jgi:hypothetical protein
MPLAMFAQVSLLLFSFVATVIVAVERDIVPATENLTKLSDTAALDFNDGNIILEGLACSAMAVAMPMLTKLRCTSCNE